jgi:hypothetical protein
MFEKFFRKSEKEEKPPQEEVPKIYKVENMSRDTREELSRDNPDFVKLVRPLVEAQTTKQVADIVRNIRETITSKYPDRIQEEDVRLFIKYCDTILEEGQMNDHESFIRVMRPVWKMLNNSNE